MTIGAYMGTDHFAYPGWRLTVPGGPAGGHYKGFTHTESAGTDIPPGDQYEQDREDGMSSHDCAHSTPHNPRGVYRSSGEVPPRPNASGAAHSYRSLQTQRHAGTSVAPGSFPAVLEDSDEDSFLGLLPTTYRPNVVGSSYYNPESYLLRFSEPATSGATSVVRQSPPSTLPLPPSPNVQVVAAPPVSPQPAPIVATHEVVPTSDGSFVNTSTGQSVAPSQVTQNPATGQLIAQSASSAISSATSWLEQSTIFPSVPNWGILAGVAALLFLGGHGARR
jgi:hypothetical protein